MDRKSVFPNVNNQTYNSCIYIYIYPIGSMYGIYANIYHQYTPNVSVYTSTMDPMGIYIYGI